MSNHQLRSQAPTPKPTPGAIDIYCSIRFDFFVVFVTRTLQHQHRNRRLRRLHRRRRTRFARA